MFCFFVIEKTFSSAALLCGIVNIVKETLLSRINLGDYWHDSKHVSLFTNPVTPAGENTHLIKVTAINILK